MLKQAEVGVPVVEVCRQAGITEQTFYRWKKQYVGLEIDQVRQLKQAGGAAFRICPVVFRLSIQAAGLCCSKVKMSPLTAE